MLPSKTQPVRSTDSGPSSEAGYAERYYWLKAMIDHIPDFIYAKDLKGRFVFANRAVVENNGLVDVADLIGTTDFDFLPADAARHVTEIERRITETGEPDLGFEEQAELGDTSRWLMMSRVPLHDETGKTIGVVGASRDITIRKQAEHLMGVQAHLLEVIARGTPLPAFLRELAVALAGIRKGIYPVILLGAELGSPLHVEAMSGLTDDYTHEVARARLQALEPSAHGSTDVNAALLQDIFDRTMSPNRPYMTSCIEIPAADGRIEGVLAIHAPAETGLYDLSDFLAIAANMVGIAVSRNRAEEQISYLARHDALTGLANRSLFEQCLNDTLLSASALGRHMAMAFIDIDNFKLINDSLGHAPGDELLKTVARRITRETADIGFVARLGGDEFVVIFEDSDSEVCFQRLLNVRHAVAQPLILNGIELRVTCSIGMACYPEHGSTAADVLVSADTAMYEAKQSGRDCIKVFDDSMITDSRSKLTRTDELRNAIARNEFTLHFQPQQDRRNGEIIGAEALIRWNHPTEGLIYPGDFIPLAEETGLIVQIGEWVVREACRISREWQRRGFHAIRTSINVSARQFQEDGLVHTISEALAESGLAPGNLEVEVTESMIMRDLDGSIAKMNELTRLGISLAVDDFGTGYSSLSALKRFPLSRLKVDRSFIKDIPDDEDDMAIASAIISLAQKLELGVIAEGVETEEQAEFLLRSGCHEIQGYLVGRPVSDTEFCVMLEAYRKARAPVAGIRHSGNRAQRAHFASGDPAAFL